MDKIGTGCLMAIILVLICYGGKYTTMYYTGKQYVIDEYVEALENREYEEIYSLIDQEELVMNKDELANYYKYYYESYNMLNSVKKCGWKEETSYIISLVLQNKEVLNDLQVIKKNNKWKIKFPFEYSDVSVKAPIGAKVKINESELEYSSSGQYVKNNLLPGKYVVSVDLNTPEVDKYMEVIELPKDKVVKLPYKVGNLQVKIPEKLKVKISDMDLENSNIGHDIKDLLVGDYEVTVFQQDGYIEPITKTVNIVEGNNNLAIDQYNLSSKGNDKLIDFMKNFYENYNRAITKHEKGIIQDYFKEAKDLDEFEEWYIKDKDIKSSEVFYEYSTAKLDELGNLSLEVLEIVNLSNKEDSSTREYKVVISWNMYLDIMADEWRVINRELKESIVAIKDSEDRWIQY